MDRSVSEYCEEKLRLIREFELAVQEVVHLRNAQVAVLLNGGEIEMEDEIRRSDERRERAKLAIIAHREEHGC